MNKKENNMNGIIYVGVAMFFIGLAFAIGGVFFGVKSMDNDFARLKTSNDELVGDLTIQRDSYEKAAKDFGEIAAKVKELESRSPNVTMSFASWPKEPLMMNLVDPPKKNASPTLGEMKSPHELLNPKSKIKQRRPAMSQ